MANDEDGVPVVLRILVKKDQDLQKTTEDIKAAVQDIFDVKASSDPFVDLKTKAEAAMTSLEVTREAIQRTFGDDSQANLSLLEGITRDLQIWQAYNGELIKQNPELRDAYRGTYQEAKARVEEVNKALQDQAKIAAQAAKEGSDAQKATKAEEIKATEEAAEATRQANQAVKQSSREAAQEVQTNARLVRELGTTLGIALTAAGAGLLGLAGAAVKSAAEFEQMEVRLQGIRGSAESAAKALALVREYAGEKGFELKGLEEASVKLEEFGLKTEQTLDSVANLAAAKGKSIEGTAQVLGLIAEGDERVFKTLARQYQITATDLRQYGAAVDDVKNKVINNTDVAEQNVKALQRLVAARWGDASAKQADTMTGAFNQARNQVTLLGNAFGKELEPFVVSGLKSIADIAGFLNGSFSPGMKEAAIISAVVGGAMLATGGAAVLLGAKLFYVNVQLEAMAVKSPLAGAALGLLETVQIGVASKMGSLVSLMGRAIFSAGGLAAGIALLAAALTNHEINAYADSQKKLGTAIEETSKKAVEASHAYHTVTDIVNDLAKTHNIEINLKGDALKQLSDIDKLFNQVSKVDMAQAAEAAGLTVEVMKQKLTGFAETSKNTVEKIHALQHAIRAVQELPSGKASQLIEEEFHKVGLEAYAADKSIDGLRGVLAQFIGQSKELEVSIGFFQRLLGVVQEVTPAFTNALKGAKELKEYLKFAEQIDSAQSLSAALDHVQERLRVLSNLDGLQGKSKQQLLDQLLDPKTSDKVKEATEQYFEFDHVKEQLLQKDKKRQDDAVKEQLRQDRLLFDEKKALGQATLSDELAMIEKELANYRLSTEEKIHLEEKAAQLRKAIPEEQAKKDELAFRHLKTLRDTSLQEELAFVQQELKLFEEGSAQRIAFEEKEAQIRKQIQQKAVKDAKDSLQSQYEATREVVDKVKDDAEHTPAQAIRAIDGVVAALMKWKAANGTILASSQEVRKEFDNLVRSTNASRAQEVSREYADNLRILKESLTKFSAEAIGENQKLLAVDSSIELVKKAQTDHLITQKQATTELAQLDKERLVVLKAQTAERAQQAIKLANLEVQAREKELQVLEKRQGRGEHLDSQVKKTEDSLFTSKISALDKETAEQIRKAGGAQDQIDIIHKEAALKRTEIVQQETERQVEEYEKRKKAFESHQKQMDDLASGKKKNKLGFSGFEAFSLPGFGDDFETSERYKRTDDSAFLGGDDSNGGDAAATYKRIMAQLMAKAGADPTSFNPMAKMLANLMDGSNGLAGLRKPEAINPNSIMAQKMVSAYDPVVQASKDNAFAVRRDYISNGNASNGMPGPGSGNNNGIAQGAAGAGQFASAAPTIHLHIDGQSTKIEERDIVKAVINWLESEGRLRGNNHPPVS